MTDDTKIGTDIGGYRILRLLGRGGMSVVYLAEDLRLGRKVAVKVIAPDLAADEGVRDRFLRESNAAASLDDPNVLPIYGAGDADGVLYIAMRYVDGTDLKALLEREGPLEPGRTVSIISQVASAIDAAHERGLVHRDVKPGNILIARTRSGEHAYLTDFGLIKRRDHATGLTKTGQFIGTLDYVAPEQVKGAEVDGRTDVYSLGCVLYECLTGEPPFTKETEVATMYAHLEEPPPTVTAKRPELPDGIDAVVARAMAKEPDARYGTAGELAGHAAAALREPEAATTAPISSRSRRLGAMVAGGVAALAVVVMAIVVLTRGGGTNPASPTSGASTNGTPPAGAAPPIDSLVRVDPSDGTIDRIAEDLPTACGTRVRIAVGEGAIWWRACTNVAHVDLASGHVDKIIVVSYGPVGTGGDPVIASRAVWMGSGARGDRMSAIAGINPATDEQLDPIPFPSKGLLGSIAFGEGRLWAGFRDGTLLGIDPASGRKVDSYRVPGGIDELAFGAGSLWCLDQINRSVKRVDPGTGKTVATVPLGTDVSEIAAGPQGVWVLSISVGTAIPIDPETNEAGVPLRVGDAPTAVVEGLGATWITDQDGFVRRIDPRTQVITKIEVGAPLAWLAVDPCRRNLVVAVGTLTS